MRAKFRFTRDFDYPVRPGVEIAYRAGSELVIPKEHAEAAQAAGAGDFLEEPAEDKPKKAKT